MNKFTKMAIVAAGAALVAQGARASFTVNDLYLGFTQSSASSDLIIDLGQGSSLSGSSSSVDLSSDLGGLSTFNSLFNNTATGVSMAVVGADNKFGQVDVYTTLLRSSGAGDPTVPGSSSAGLSTAGLSTAASKVSGLASGGLPAAGSSISDNNKTYSSAIEGTANSFTASVGVNPGNAIDSSGTLMEDLYKGTSTGYTYEGYLTFNYGNDSLTFTPATAVPEPATYGLFAGAGLLVLSLRRQFRRKTA